MKTIYIYLFIFLSLATFAQQTNIKGKIIDASGNPLQGTSIILLKKDSTFVQGIIANQQGEFLFKNIRTGTYILRCSFIGFENRRMVINVNKNVFDAGTIKMKEKVNYLNEVTVKEKAKVVEIKGDTTEFRSSAFKVHQDATAEDLVTKIPGAVNESGTLKVQGESVKKVLVDGKEFFGDDVNIALKTIPAEIVDKIQIYDQMSEQAKFTGFSDGETSKTLNIKTINGVNNAVFGRVQAGYGFNDKYLFNGNINYFNNNRRISILGMSNNVNQQNFSMQDLLGVFSSSGGRMMGGSGGDGAPGPPPGSGPDGGANRNTADFMVSQSGGINKANSIGLNYIDKWSEKLSVSVSYFFNSVNNQNNSTTNRTYLTTDTISQKYHETSDVSSKNLNHRINAKIEYSLNENNSIIFTPGLSIQNNNSSKSVLAATTIGSGILNNSNLINSDLSGYSLSSNLLYRHKFSLKGRTLSMSVDYAQNDKDGDTKTITSVNSGGEIVSSTNSQKNINEQAYNQGITLTYTEPLFKNWLGLFTVNSSWVTNKANTTGLAYDTLSQNYSDLDILTSNKYSYETQVSKAGTAIKYSKNGLNLNSGVDFQTSTFDGKEIYPTTFDVNHVYNNVLLKADLFYHFNSMGFMHINYRTTASLPSLSQLQNILDYSDPMNLYIGNPTLDQQYKHSFHIAFHKIDSTRTKNLFVVATASLSDNYIANSTYTSLVDSLIYNNILLNKGVKLTYPFNMTGYRTYSLFTTYSLPVSLIHCNWNIYGNYSYSSVPSIINDLKNNAVTNSVGGGTGFVSNISKNVDFRISQSLKYNTVENSLSQYSNSSYISATTSFNLNLTIFSKVNLSLESSYNRYSGLSQSYDQEYILANAGIGYKFLKNNAAELNVKVYDIFNQNQSLSKNITSTYIEDVETQVLKQYVMVSFIYKINSLSSNNNNPMPGNGNMPPPPPMRMD